jgi:O-antigen/teichoic acid export membrane protein
VSLPPSRPQGRQGEPKGSSIPDDHLVSIEAIGQRARSGGLWTIGAQAGQQGLSLLATLVLARLLTQSDFGVVALATSIVGISSLIFSIGIDAIVIRRPVASETFLASVFWVSTGIAIVIVVGLVTLAPFVASAFNTSSAAGYIRVLALAPAFTLVASVPVALLRRRMQFGRLVLVEVTGMAVYVSVQIVLALSGYGAWSIIIGQVSMTATNFLLALILARWVPHFQFSLGDVTSELGFAGGNFAANTIIYATKNVDYWLVGAVLGTTSLGIYYMAFVLPSILRLRLSAAAGKVLLPVFSRLRNDPDRRYRSYREALRVQIGIGVPAMIGVVVLAEPIVAVLFGPDWNAAVVPLRWLALATMLDLVTYSIYQAAIADGQVARLIILSAMRLVILVPALGYAVAVRGELAAVAVAVLIASAVALICQQPLLGRKLGLPLRPMAGDVLAIVVSSLAMASVVLGALRLVTGWAPGVQVLLGCSIGILIYTLSLKLIFRNTYRMLRNSITRAFASNREGN